MKETAMNIVNELGTMYGLKSALAAVWAFIAGDRPPFTIPRIS